MQGCKCTKCGADIKYVPTSTGNIKVEAEYQEIVTDRGRIMQGHFRHKCPADKTKKEEAGG
jgi:hypothetical protein